MGPLESAPGEVEVRRHSPGPRKLIHLRDTPFIIHTISLRNIPPYSFINVSPEVLLLPAFFSVFPYGKKLFLIRSGSPEGKTLPPFLCIPQDSVQISHSFVLTSESPLGTSQLFPTVQVHRFRLVLVQSSGSILF